MLINQQAQTVLSNCQLLQFQPKGDERGSLVALEANLNIPFEIKRVYYIFNTQTGVTRGLHAHKKLKQVLVCTSGSCKIKLNDGQTEEIVDLSNPALGLCIEGLIWREMFDFSKDCVLMVLASEYYDESDYIRDYGQFLDEVKRNG